MLDFDELAFQVSEAHRLIENLIRLGTVSSVAGDRCVVVDGSGLKTAPLPWLTRRAGADRDWWCPSVGEQVVLLCPGGRPEQGVVLPALYSDAFAAPTRSPDVREARYSDGLVVRHDKGGRQTEVAAAQGAANVQFKTVAVNAGGAVEVRAKTVVVKATDTIKFQAKDVIIQAGGQDYRLVPASSTGFHAGFIKA